MQIITNIEDLSDSGYTRGWIVPDGIGPDDDLELEATDHVDVEATEDEVRWHVNLVDALTHAGWALAGEIRRGGATITAPVVRKTVADVVAALNSYCGSDWQDVWQDVIMDLPVDEDRTAEIDPSGASNVVVLRTGETLRWDAQRRVWYEA